MVSDCATESLVEVMTESACWAECFFACQKLGVHRAMPTAKVAKAVTDDGIVFTFHCPLSASSTPATIRAVGDPDLFIRGDQVRVQIAWGTSHTEKLFVQAAIDARRCGEYGDRHIIPDSKWSLNITRQQESWQAKILLPWALLPENVRARWQSLAVSFVWCSQAGMMSWPTPFVTWHSWRLLEASLPLESPSIAPDELAHRAEQLLQSLPQRLGSYPDDAPDWQERFAAMLLDPHPQADLATVVHRRAANNLVRTFLQPDGDPEQSLSYDLKQNLAMLEQFDATGNAPQWGRGELLVNLAAIYLRDNDQSLCARLEQSIWRWLENHPITRGLQPRIPAGDPGSASAFPDVWAPHIIGSHTMGHVMRALFTLSMRRPIDPHLLTVAFKRGSEAFRFGIETVPAQYHWNHSINWINKMIEIATLSLEMADAQQRIASGWRCMNQAFETMILPDGISQELCSIYHYVAFYRLMESLDACEDSGQVVPKGMWTWAQRLLESRCLTYLLPNGQDAGFSDSNPMAPDGFHAPILENESYLRRVCGKLNRPDLLYMSTGGRHGQKPTTLNHAARYAGVYAARTGWTRDDYGLILDAGPMGRAHAHDDRLNLVYSYKNRILLIDHTYPSGLSPDGFNSRSAEAHSTITIDGYQSDYISDFFKRVNRQEQTQRFETQGDLHFFQATHHLEEINGSNRITVHRRIVSNLSRFIWIIDELEGQGSCIARNRFVLPAGSMELSENRFATTSGSIDLAGMSLDGLRAESRGVSWPPEAAGRRIVEFAGDSCELPFTRSFLFLPFEGGLCPWPTVVASPVADPLHLQLNWPDGRTETLNW